MSTVDEILASGRYTDRRGRGWDYVETVTSWCSPEIDAEGVSWGYHYIDTAQMRLLVERDRHRDECKGIGFCLAHPVPNVIAHKPHLFEVFGARNSSTLHADRFACTLPEAMDAARALAVGP